VVRMGDAPLSLKDDHFIHLSIFEPKCDGLDWVGQSSGARRPRGSGTAVSGGELHPTVLSPVESAQVEEKLSIGEQPDVIISCEIQALSTLVLEIVTNLAGEIEVVIVAVTSQPGCF